MLRWLQFLTAATRCYSRAMFFLIAPLRCTEWAHATSTAELTFSLNSFRIFSVPKVLVSGLGLYCSLLASWLNTIWDLKHSLTFPLCMVYREAWSTDTLSGYTVAVSTILALAHLLTGLAIKSWGACLVAVKTWPTRLTCTLSWHWVAAGDKRETYHSYRLSKPGWHIQVMCSETGGIFLYLLVTVFDWQLVHLAQQSHWGTAEQLFSAGTHATCQLCCLTDPQQSAVCKVKNLTNKHIRHMNMSLWGLLTLWFERYDLNQIWTLWIIFLITLSLNTIDCIP